MEVFIDNLDPFLSEKRLRTYLKEKFKLFGIELFHCEKKRQKPFATATLLDVANGERFLQAYSVRNGGARLVLGREFRCVKSRFKADENKIRCLEKQLIDQARKTAKGNQGSPTIKQFLGSSVCCGTWDYPDGNLTFVPHLVIPRPLRVYFGRKELVVMVDRMYGSPDELELRIGIEYSSIHSLACVHTQDSSMMLTLYNAPKFYKLPHRPETSSLNYNGWGANINPGHPDLAEAVSRLSLKNSRLPLRVRTNGLSRAHADIVNHCLVYQLKLSFDHLQAIRRLLHHKTFLPDIVNWPYHLAPGPSPQKISMAGLLHLLQESYHSLEFGVKFQLQRLAQNAFLLPHVVAQFIPSVLAFEKREGFEATVYALQQMSKEIPYSGPGTEASNFSIGQLEELLERPYESVLEKSAFKLARQHTHLVLIHRAHVTPTGIILDGPYPETRNSVLDRFSQFAPNFFLRVSFGDENEGSLKFEQHTDLTEIHRNRFQGILNTSIDIAGQKFRFLGFSHSSLRDQTCWFTAPFVYKNSLAFGKLIIKELGNFSAIKSPAKCAARIGQAFTDLNDSITLAHTAVSGVPDVERNSRCFSDGCSVASEAVFRKLWRPFKPGRTKPTLFQIRYGGKINIVFLLPLRNTYERVGVKGMISLDKGLAGDKLYIRPSQEKFPSDSEMLGVCSAATRPLPLYLNKPLIKVLEDLGVDKDIFMTLQFEAMGKLRAIAHSPINASTFLEMHDIAKSSNFAWLVKELHYLGISALDDHFIWAAIELVLIMRLRDLKYRGRIPVEDGATLYGIMDETGILREGQVYCALDNDEMIKGRVTITRSPVMHPGDIQFVEAVDVPEDCRLKDLHNCVVFSQHGNRDLPSQLSGGDLDGDIFNIIVDKRLQPPRAVPPADYPRPEPIDIGRPVETEDITNFFINFMSNDQVGRISNIHLQLADQKLRGTEDSDCLKLANMHSTAVDFSKTGIPVSIPRHT